MAEPEVPEPSPGWLLALGGLVMALIAVGLVYAVSIALRNLNQIGV